MTWTDLQSDVADAVLSEDAFGQSATYRPNSEGAGVSVLVIDTPEAQAVGEGGFVELRHEIHLSRAAPVSPARGDSLTLVDGTTLIVQQAVSEGPFWRLTVRQAGS